jgi:hypothetical protein
VGQRPLVLMSLTVSLAIRSNFPQLLQTVSGPQSA